MKFVEVRIFDDYISAYVILGRLKEEDIVCHLENEHTMTLVPFLSPIYGGIKLMVPEAQEQRAKDLLAKWEDEPVS